MLQKLAYLAVIFVLLPLMLLTGLAMSPGMDAAFPFLLDIFGGRQIGAHHPLHRRSDDRAVRRRASRHGADLGRLEQYPLDDHRPLRDRAGGGKVMSDGPKLDRRGFLARGARGGEHGAARRLRTSSPNRLGQRMLDSAETLTRVTQRALSRRRSRANTARPTSPSDFKANGSTNPDDAAYQRSAENGFADWRLEIGGLVETAAELSLAELRAMPSRTQITRHDCVEGWSCIGKWKGVPLGAAAEQGGLKPEARYIVFYCADDLADTGDGERQILREHRAR